MKPKPRTVRKSKSIKRVLEYEHTPEDKKRRKFLAVRDRGQVFGDNSWTRRTRDFLDMALRQGSHVRMHGSRLLKWIDERIDMIGAFISIMSVWFSGWLAAKGFVGWSLVVFIAGIVIGAAMGRRR